MTEDAKKILEQISKEEIRINKKRIDALKKAMKENGITKQDIIDKLGMSEYMVTNILNGVISMGSYIIAMFYKIGLCYECKFKLKKKVNPILYIINKIKHDIWGI